METETVFRDFSVLSVSSNSGYWINFKMPRLHSDAIGYLKSSPVYFCVKRNNKFEIKKSTLIKLEKLNVLGAMNLTSGKFTAICIFTHWTCVASWIYIKSLSLSDIVLFSLHSAQHSISMHSKGLRTKLIRKIATQCWDIFIYRRKSAQGSWKTPK